MPILPLLIGSSIFGKNEDGITKVLESVRKNYHYSLGGTLEKNYLTKMVSQNF